MVGTLTCARPPFALTETTTFAYPWTGLPGYAKHSHGGWYTYLCVQTTRKSPWHGRLHDLSFVLLGLPLFPAMLVLGFAFHTDLRWRNFTIYTWGTLALAGPAFFIKGAAFYVFLFAILL